MGADGTKEVHSRDLCFLLKVKIGKDNKMLLLMEFKLWFHEDINRFKDK